MTTSQYNPIQLELPFDGTIIIPLTQGQQTIIDVIDADLANLKWYAKFNVNYGNGGKFLVMRRTLRINGKRSVELLHRVILSRILDRSLKKDEQVDHIDCNPLNNRRGNLRLATPSQNGTNQSRPKNNTSGFKGVHWDKRAKKWMATIRINGKKTYLGLFATPELAYAAYCEAALKYHGEFARLK